jgi:hypothetical protein
VTITPRQFKGDSYWCIGLEKKDVEVYLHADRITIEDGVLSAWIAEPSRLALAFAPGAWRFVYAASVFDGAAVDIEHWPGQISEGR